MASHFLLNFEFQSILEREIWTLHAEGKSLRFIAANLRARGYRIFKDRVHALVKELRAEMLGRARAKK